MSDSELDRRRFIVAAIAFSGVASAFGHSRAWAQAGSDVGADTLGAMADMARRLFPHSAIEDSVYAAILDDALAATAADGSFAATLNAAENALNAQQGGRFADLAESDQLAAMRAVQNEPFFAGIQAAVRTRLYNHPAVWEMLGYEGPSFGQGGYLNRGAGVIDWLPENP